MKIVNKKINELIAAEYNPRKLSPDQFEQIKSSIQRFGFVDPVIVNTNPDRLNIIVGGHQRVKVAREIGIRTVPCVEVDLDEAKERELNVRLNRNTGEWDWEILRAEFDVSQLSDWGFGDDELEEFEVPDEAEGLTSEDAVPEPPKEPITKLGHVWKLGDHRIMCGDSTSKEDVEKLMAGQKADMVLTDPPYGVAYVGKTKDALTIKSDNLSETELIKFCAACFDNAEGVSRLGAYLLATVPPGPLHEVFFSDWKRRGILRQIMVWVKDSMVLGHSEYHYKHEPILFGWVPGGDRLKNSDRTKTTVWEFNRPKRSAEHPTIKPLEMWCYAIKQHTTKKNILFEPFSGSGTTHIACEKTGRKCYGMELDPKYCDVIIKRWEDFTGKKAELLEE